MHNIDNPRAIVAHIAFRVSASPDSISFTYSGADHDNDPPWSVKIAGHIPPGAISNRGRKQVQVPCVGYGNTLDAAIADAVIACAGNRSRGWQSA